MYIYIFPKKKLQFLVWIKNQYEIVLLIDGGSRLRMVLELRVPNLFIDLNE